MKTKYSSFAVAVAASLLLISCAQDENPTAPLLLSDPTPAAPTPPTVVPPGDSLVNQAPFVKVLKSQMLTTSGVRAGGSAAMEHIGPLIADMSFEDLDFEALKNLSFSFDRGIYEATYGEDHLRLVFTFAENFDAFDAGDTVPYNLFSIDSYVRNVVITWRGITYDEGPLFHLINGSIHFDGLQPAVRIGAEKLLFSMEYNGVRYIAQPGNLTDTLHTFIHSAPANVEWIATQLMNDGYTLIFDSTRYASCYYDLDGVVEASQLNVRQRENTYWVDGRVSGRIVQDGRYYYYRGVYSNHGENVAEFSLTPAWDKLLGTSRQELDMRSGYFTSATGDALAYQLP